MFVSRIAIYTCTPNIVNWETLSFLPEYNVILCALHHQLTVQKIITKVMNNKPTLSANYLLSCPPTDYKDRNVIEQL